MAFHGLQLKIKRELHSPCSELSSACFQDPALKLQYGGKRPYGFRWGPGRRQPVCDPPSAPPTGTFCPLSVFEQKPPAVMKVSSPVTPPSSTPVSPLHHPSPTAAPTPKPDRTYAPVPSSLPLPDGAYDLDHRYRQRVECGGSTGSTGAT